jgi:two-component system, chemotaxis family, sensor kinase CheA
VTEDDEIVQAFLEESGENLDQLERDLVELEAKPQDPELLAQVYRAIHTIKGTCGFLGYQRLEALTHAGEDLLDALRSGRLLLDGGIASSLLNLTDAVRAALDRIATTGGEGDDAHPATIAALTAHLSREPSPSIAADPEPEAETSPPDQTVAPEQTTAPAVAAPEEPQAAAPASTSTHESSVRVDVVVLDKLMDLVGELILTRSQIGNLAAETEEGPLVLPYRQLRRVTTELQENILKARLQPVGAVMGRFPRIARDLAGSMGKSIRVELGGEDVGVDKAVNEALKDALLHLVRNTVDHGIESPAERIAAGKDPEGRLSIRASHEGERIRLELSDDGRGIDPQRLAARAVSAELLTREEADALSVAESMELMFLPGLSTKTEITTVSGRGVGMDIVRTNLNRIGGSIEVSSEVGGGSMFCINVPLTLAVVPIVQVWSGGGRYALPQIHVQEVVHLDPDVVLSSVHELDGARIHRLRDRLLALVDLADQLGVTAAATPADGLTVVVVEIHGKRFGLVVDAVGDTSEVVVEPLTRATRSIALFAGVTILSDGRPTLIVELGALALAAGVGAAHADGPGQADVSDTVVDESSLLLATGIGGGRIAVSLSAVRRLERFSCRRVQRSGAIDVVEYDGAILPLLRLEGLLPDSCVNGNGLSGPPAEHVQTIVCDSSGGPVGLVVERIDDVVIEPPALAQPRGRRGVLRRLVIDDHVTELLDVEALVADAHAGAPG